MAVVGGSGIYSTMQPKVAISGIGSGLSKKEKEEPTETEVRIWSHCMVVEF